MRKILSTTVVLSLCLLAAAYVSAAAEAPGIRVLDSIKDIYTPVKFDHPKHVSLAGSCSACHHEHGIADGLPCKQCHALTPQSFKNSVSHSFMACKNCHGSDRDNAKAPVFGTAGAEHPGAQTKISRDMPGLKTAYHKQCFSCHRGMGNIGTDPKGCAEICHAKKADKVGMHIRK